MIKAMMYPFKRRALDKTAAAGTLHQIFIEKDAEFKPSQYNNFFDSFYTLYDKKRPEWVSFEFHGTRSGIRLYSWLSGGVSKEFLQSNINSIHPAAETTEVKDDYARFGRLYGREVACATMELDSHYLFNLLQSDGDKVGADLMASLCASMQNLDDHEEVAVQFLLRPVDYKALSIANAHFELYKKYGKRPSRMKQPYAKYNPYLFAPKALGAALKHATMGSAGAKDNTSTTMTPIQRKLEAGVYFDLTIRIWVANNTHGKPRARLQTVISAFAPATDKNRLRAYMGYQDKTVMRVFKIKERTKFLKEYEQRRIHTYPVENYVSPAELATLLHFPSKHIPNVIRLRAKKLPVPDGIIQYDSVENAWKDGAIVFGRSNFRGRRKYLAFKDIKMLMQHLYCIGGTGSGKSFWLSFLGLQIAKITGLTFFDVKGDIADEFLRHLPKSEWKRVFYIDLQEDMYFFPFNVLRETGMSVYNLASLIVSVFLKAFSEGSIKEHSQNVLRQALIAVISTNPEGSLLEVYRMFTDEQYLDWTIAEMEKGTEFPDVLAYWKRTFKKMRAGARKSECGAILSKLKVITQNERPRYCMSQTDNILRWRKMMDERAIILVNFAIDKNTDEIISFFGTMFTSFMSQALFSRGDTPVHERVEHIMMLDEFEMFVDQDADIKRFLELIRSYGGGLVMAHQSVEQIPTDLLGMIEDNTFTQIGLLMGTASAPHICKMFPGTDPEDLVSMEEYTGYAKLRKLNPAPFTFESVDMRDYFEAASWEELRKWKDEFKRKHYRHMSTIKGDINERYALVERNEIADEDSPAVRKGKGSGKIKRGEVASEA